RHHRAACASTRKARREILCYRTGPDGRRIGSGNRYGVAMLNINKADLLRHHEPGGVGDRFALGTARLLSWGAGKLFGRRYGGRAVVIETIAAVPAMVAATLLHLTCLRR